MASTEQIGQGNGGRSEKSSARPGEAGRRLDSWKAIAQYLDRDVRSVQRWERDRHLPIHRLPGQKGAAVFAFESELEEWLRSGQEKTGVDLGLPPNHPSQRPAANPKSPVTSIYLWTALVFVLLVVAGLSFAWFRAESSQPIRSIAVLPLQNFSTDPNQEYFADGMTDELITDLAQIRELKVVSKTSVMQYKDAHKSLPQIGRELGVDAVVEGSVVRSGDHVRITAQLIRASTDRHIWAHAYEGDLKNVLSLQARIAESISDEVRLKLTGQERGRLAATRAYDPEAYDLYLRGHYLAARRTEQALQEATTYYRQAVAKDPSFALAYAGLADCETLLALFGAGNSWASEAAENARKALAIDDNLAEAHTSLAAVSVLNWKWEEAEKEFRRSLDQSPNDAQSRQWYGNLFLGPMGRHSEAIAELQRALELDPLSPIINTDLGYAYFLAGAYDSAYASYQKALALDPNFLPVHYQLFAYYQQRGMYDRQVEELVKTAILAGRPLIAEDIRRFSNDRQQLFKIMAETRGNFNHPLEYSGSYPTAVDAYLIVADKRQALTALQQAYQRRDAYMIFIKVNPLLSSLRGDPAFQDIEHKVGLL